MKNGFQYLKKNYRVISIVLSLFALSTSIAEAATINVSSLAALQTAVNNSTAGAIINLANGHYTNCNLTISKSNITVQAATAGGVYLDGTSTITIAGNNTTFGGFQFTANVTANGTNTITVNGNTNTITQLNFNGYSADHFLYITGQYNVVSYSNFQNKTAVMTAKAGTGDMVQIIPNATNPGYNTIRYCSFQHLPGMGGDYGNECIRIGNGTLSTFISRTIVEYCYFEDTGLGDSETISVKSRENVLRYNTMNNNPDAMFCFRNGDNNVAYGNFFINSGGLRVKEANNIFCYNNYFEKSGLTGTMDAVTYIYDTSNSIYVLDNINFLHNTFVDCGLIDFGGVGATNGTWANNIFKKTGTIFSNANAGTSFKGNIYNGTLGITIPSGMTSTDPQLTLNSNSYYCLSATSPGINSAVATYPALLNIPGVDTLLMDIQGKARPVARTQKDVGCEEYNATGTSINHPLKLSETGPSYLKSLTTTIHPIDDNWKLTISSNQTTGQLNVTYTLTAENQVNLEIFNLNGQLVKSFLNNQKQLAGPHSQSFDIKCLTSGIFLARFSTNTYSKTVKFIVDK
jgi:hypothetical protein